MALPLDADDEIHAVEAVTAENAGVLSLTSVIDTVSVAVAVSVAALSEAALNKK